MRRVVQPQGFANDARAHADLVRDVVLRVAVLLFLIPNDGNATAP